MIPPVLTSRGGLGSSFSQLFGFGYPGYGGQLTLNLPLKNRGAQAELGTALVARHRDGYSAQQAQEQITLEVSSAVHHLEEAKLTLSAGKTAQDLAQKALAAEQRKYELGSQTIFSSSTRRPGWLRRNRICCKRKSAIKSPKPAWTTPPEPFWNPITCRLPN